MNDFIFLIPQHPTRVRREIFFPQKEASLSGDRNKFSLLNIVEVAQAAELSDVLGMSTDRMKSAAHRQQLTPK